MIATNTLPFIHNLSDILIAVSPLLPLAIQQHHPIVVTGRESLEKIPDTRAEITYETGMEALDNYLPNWKEELSAKLSPTQLSIVEEAFKSTDAVAFADDNQTDWQYRDIFEKKFDAFAKETGVEFSKATVDAVVGRKSYFGKLLILESVYSCLYALGHYPWQYSRQTNLTEEQIQERALNQGVHNAIRNGTPADPIIAKLIKLQTSAPAVKRGKITWDQVLEK